MANTPIKSIVAKTAKPTTAQTVQAARAQQAAFNSGLPNPRALPNLTNISPATGATVGSGSRPPLNPRFGGAAAALTRGLKPTHPAPVPAKPKVRVIVHPSGKIEVHNNAPAAAPASAPAPAQTAHPVVKPVVKPKVVPKRAPASVAAGAPGLSDNQLAANQVSAAFDPVAKQLQDFYTQQTQGEANAIKGATSGLADLYKQYAPAAAASYGQAENSQAAVGAALSKALVGQSDAAQAGLAAQLAKIGNPESAAVMTGQAAKDAQGAQGVQAAGSSAALTGLIGQAATAADYGAKLPGLAGLYGLNATQSATSRLGNDFNTAIQGLNAKRPEAMQAALAGIAGNRFKQQQLNLERDAFGLKKNADTRAQVALDNQTATTLSNLYGVDAKGNLTLAGRKVAALEQKAQAAAKKKTGGLSQTSLNNITSKASKDAETFYYGKSPSQYQGQPVAGTGTPPILYPQAVQRLMAKYPGLTIARATKILNSYYKPGEGGRPLFTKKQQDANAVAFPSPFSSLPGVTG